MVTIPWLIPRHHQTTGDTYTLHHLKDMSYHNTTEVCN